MKPSKPGRVLAWIAIVFAVVGVALTQIPFYSPAAGGNGWWAIVCIIIAFCAQMLWFRLKWIHAKARAAQVR